MGKYIITLLFYFPLRYQINYSKHVFKLKSIALNILWLRYTAAIFVTIIQFQKKCIHWETSISFRTFKFYSLEYII
jgi:hypothetical protein